MDNENVILSGILRTNIKWSLNKYGRAFILFFLKIQSGGFIMLYNKS
jgi:hypothetical protein